jgi:hypothetical protein
MRIKPRLEKLELITEGCPECGGPPTPGSPLEIRVSNAHPDKPESPIDDTRCDRCGLLLRPTIKVRGMPSGC